MTYNRPYETTRFVDRRLGTNDGIVGAVAPSIRNRSDCCRPGCRHSSEFDEFGRDTTTLASVIPASTLRLFVMANGKVDFFNDTGGYGFISTDDEDDDVFFHMEDVGGPDLEEGTEIEFDIEQAPKGPRATNVVRN